MMNRVKHVYLLYSRALEARPFLVNSLSTAALVGTGDLLAQTLFEEKKYDLHRTAGMAFVGGTVVAPCVFAWYKFLEMNLGTGLPLLKVFLDQCLFAPVMLPTFVTAVDLAEGKSFQEAKSHVRREYWPLLKVNWAVWPAFQAINFTFVPFHLRVLTVQFFSIFWNTFLSWRVHLKNVKKDT